MYFQYLSRTSKLILKIWPFESCPIISTRFTSCEYLTDNSEIYFVKLEEGSDLSFLSKLFLFYLVTKSFLYNGNRSKMNSVTYFLHSAEENMKCLFYRWIRTDCNQNVIFRWKLSFCIVISVSVDVILGLYFSAAFCFLLLKRKKSLILISLAFSRVYSDFTYTDLNLRSL